MMNRRVGESEKISNRRFGGEDDNERDAMGDAQSAGTEEGGKTNSVRSWTSDNRKELFRSLLGGDEDDGEEEEDDESRRKGSKSATPKGGAVGDDDDDEDDSWANREEGSLQLYSGNDAEEEESKTNMDTVVEGDEEGPDQEKDARPPAATKKSRGGRKPRANSWEEDEILNAILPEGHEKKKRKDKDSDTYTREDDDAAPTREIVFFSASQSSKLDLKNASKAASGSDRGVQGSRTHSQSTQSTSNRRRHTFYDRGSANHNHPHKSKKANDDGGDDDDDDEDDNASVATYGVSGILESIGVGGAGMKATSSNYNNSYSYPKTNSTHRPSSSSRHRHSHHHHQQNNNNSTTSMGFTTTPSTNHHSSFIHSPPNTGISRRSVATSVSSLPVDVASLSQMSGSYAPSTVHDNNTKHSAAVGASGWRNSIINAFGGRVRNVLQVAGGGKPHHSDMGAPDCDGTVVSGDDGSVYSETSSASSHSKMSKALQLRNKSPAQAKQQMRMMHLRAGMLIFVLVSTIYVVFQITAMAEHDRRIIRKLRYGVRDGTHQMAGSSNSDSVTTTTKKIKDSDSSSSSSKTIVSSKSSSSSSSSGGVSDRKKKDKDEEEEQEQEQEEEEEEGNSKGNDRKSRGGSISSRLKNFAKSNGRKNDGDGELIPVFGNNKKRSSRREEEESEALASANDDMFVSGTTTLRGNSADHGPSSTKSKKQRSGQADVANLYRPPGIAGDDEQDDQDPSSGNRDLDELLKEKMPVGFKYLVELSSPAQRARPGTPLFWMVPRGGGTVVSDILTYCQGAVLASEVGRAYVDDQLRVMPLNGHKFVNVDTFSPDGIAHAKAKGLVESGLANVIVSSHLHEVMDLFDEKNRGRAFVMMRHPVERAVSLYNHLKSAGNPNVAALSLEEYAKSHFVENNWMTRFLSGQTAGDLSMTHLGIAKEVLRRKFIIGLLDQKELAMKRFEQFFGWTYNDNPAAQTSCRKRVFAGNDLSMESDKTQVREGSQAWSLLEWQNQMDIKLYQYAHHLFGEQGREIFPDVVVVQE